MIVGSDLFVTSTRPFTLQVMGRGPWLVVVIACKTRYTLVNDRTIISRWPILVIRMYCGADALMEAVRMSMLCKRRLLFLEAVRMGKARHVCFIGKIRMRVTRMIMCATCHWFPLPPVFLWVGGFLLGRVKDLEWVSVQLGLKNVFKEESYFIFRAGDAHEIYNKLSVKEFRDRFCIPNGVIVEFLNGEDVVSTEKAEQDTVIFSKEQFNAGLRFPLPALFKEFLHFTRFHPSSFIPTSSGADGMQHHKHAVQPRPYAAGGVFCYSLKKVKNDIFSMSAHLPSLQLVTEAARLDEGRAKGLVMVRGAWAGSKHPARPFSPNYSLVIPGPEKRGHLVDWVEKASFACLNAKGGSAGEHYTVKDLPIYQEFKEAD
ncbi:hypothetical protein CK203_052930 [Vitis vinifera]|uniref:Uncharacterized protein n=1 Tax=Vitis vinifera TaxID=29760 RepID=A0A438GSZ1_VITVI|nr:hypothetical protein CK203_052930 [Vitis vinifera]